MLSVTSGYKTANKSNVVRSNGKISVYDTVALTTKEFDNTKVGLIEITGTTFRDGRIIGNLSMHDIKIEMFGDTSADFTLNTEKHITPSFAMLVSGSYEWLAYQKFIVSSVEYDDTTRMTTIRGADFLWKSNVDFVDTNTYPMTLYNYLLSVGTACGLSIENVSIVNGSFSIASKPFPDFTPCSYILSRIAELGGYFVRIKKSNNKLELINAFPSIAIPSETLTKDHYFQAWVKEHNFGTNGINTLVMKISQVEGENNSVENAPNVAIDGAIELQVVDNDIVNTETKRLAVINNIFTVVDGFKFVPCIVDYIGYPYLEVGDTVQVTKMDSTTFVTVITDVMISYDGGMKGQIRGQTLNKTQTTYRNYTTQEKRLRNAEIRVDKVEGEILLKVSQTDLDTQLEDYSTITQTADKVALEIGQIKVGGTNLLLGSDMEELSARNLWFKAIGTETTTDGSGDTVFQGKNLIVIVPANTLNGGVYRAVGNLVIGQQYTLSAWVYVPSGQWQMGTDLGYPSFTITPLTWTRVSHTFTATSSVHTLYFIAVQRTEDTAIYIDNVQLEEGNKPTAWGLNPNEMRTAKYIFDGSKARFYGDGQEWYDALGNLKVYFDTTLGNYVFKGSIDTSENVTVGKRIDMAEIPVTTVFELGQERAGLNGVGWGERSVGGLNSWAYITAYNAGPYNGVADKWEMVLYSQANIQIASPEITYGRADSTTNHIILGNTLFDKPLQVFDGIKFPETQVASTNANTLDDYEEGTWTPTLVCQTTAGVGTYTDRKGRYTKIGNVCYFTMNLSWTAHTGTGNMFITGLPFTALEGTYNCQLLTNNLTYTGQITGTITTGESRIVIYTYVGGGALGVVNKDSAADIYLSGFYLVE